MGIPTDNNSAHTADLLGRAGGGDPQALDELLARHQPRLRHMVELRLDRRLHPQLSAADVVRDACAGAAARLGEYLADPRLSFFLWLRLVVGQHLMELHRRHLGAAAGGGLEVSLYRGALPRASSAALAARLLGKQTATTQALARAERLLRLQEAINTLDPVDREVVSLRHFEELTLAEAAQVLGLPEPAAAKRYVRALKRLKDILATLPGGPGGN
jgi:RNA polymerase sigma-70 factor (ECF subfamily)